MMPTMRDVATELESIRIAQMPSSSVKEKEEDKERSV